MNVHVRQVKTVDKLKTELNKYAFDYFHRGGGGTTIKLFNYSHACNSIYPTWGIFLQYPAEEETLH